jgi:hypothetical protein
MSALAQPCPFCGHLMAEHDLEQLALCVLAHVDPEDFCELWAEDVDGPTLRAVL